MFTQNWIAHFLHVLSTSMPYNQTGGGTLLICLVVTKILHCFTATQFFGSQLGACKINTAYRIITYGSRAWVLINSSNIQTTSLLYDMLVMLVVVIYKMQQNTWDIKCNKIPGILFTHVVNHLKMTICIIMNMNSFQVGTAKCKFVIFKWPLMLHYLLKIAIFQRNPWVHNIYYLMMITLMEQCWSSLQNALMSFC